MRFDLELVRDVLLDIEELHQPPERMNFSEPQDFNRASKYPIEKLVYHMRLLDQADYIEWAPTFAGGDILYYSSINGLTYTGHQFLETIRQPLIWRQTKDKASALHP